MWSFRSLKWWSCIKCNSGFGLSVAAEHNSSRFLRTRPELPRAAAKETRQNVGGTKGLFSSGKANKRLTWLKKAANERRVTHVTRVYFRFWIFPRALFSNIRMHGVVIHHTFLFFLFFTNLSCSFDACATLRHDVSRRVIVRSPTHTNRFKPKLHFIGIVLTVHEIKFSSVL